MTEEPKNRRQNTFLVLWFCGSWIFCLQQFASQVRKRRPLAFFERDVGKDRLPLHTIDEIGQAVGKRIEIWLIDLLDVAGQNDLRPFTGPREIVFTSCGVRFWASSTMKKIFCKLRPRM